MPPPREFAFIVSTDDNKPDGTTRKLIRREVMKGKNKGRTLPPRRPKQAASPCGVPARVGSDLSFWPVVAQGVDPSVLTPVINFAKEAKPAMFVLQSYFDFPRHSASAWCEVLNSDTAYLNAVLAGTHAYFDYLSGVPLATVQQRLHSSRHLVRCLQILRQRLSNEHDSLRLADTTTMTILSLASFSTRTRQDEASKYHLRGLREIIALKGGIRSMRGNLKLLIETFRCDISLALNAGTDPIFFHDPQAEPFLPYLDQLPGFLPPGAFRPLPAKLFVGDERLGRAWDTTSTFCSLVTYAAQQGRTIPQDTYLNTMASVVYRVLAIHDLDPLETDGALRLGLLGFCSRIFVQWARLRVPHQHLCSLYRECLGHLRATGQASPEVMLWLVFVGHVCVVGPEGESWLVPCIRDATVACGLKTWKETQAVLNKYLWIDVAHSESGEAIFEEAFGCGDC